MSDGIVTIDRRYRGPLTSANGGYAAGILGSRFSEGAEVTLRRPPPLERPLSLRRDGERLLLEDGEELVAEAVAADPALEAPVAPDLDEARLAAADIEPWGSRDFSECFVCGARNDGSGLGIRAGHVPGRGGLVAAPWIARDVATEVVWAVIDCPGAYAVGDPGRGDPVLGRITARVERLPREREQCVVVGWPLGIDGRKLYAGTALYGEGGDVLAVGRQVWIQPRGA
jgi:hypothetical protein